MFNKFRKVFRKNNRERKIFAYENSEGDKGIIIAYTESEARALYKEKHPKRKIVDDDDYWNNGAYLYEFCELSDKSELYCVFEW